MVRQGLLIVLLLSLLLGTGCADRSSNDAGDREPRTVATPGPGWDPWHARFSPDASEIAFFGWDPSYRPRVGLVRDGTIEAITDERFRAADFTWLDARRLIVAYRDGNRAKLGVFSLDGRLKKGIVVNRPFRSETTGMAVSPDGRLVVISALAPGRSDGPADLLLIDMKSGHVKNLTNTPSITELWPSFVNDDSLLLTAGRTASHPEGPSGWAEVLDIRSGDVERLTGNDLFVDSAVPVPGAESMIVDTAFQDDRGLLMIGADGKTTSIVGTTGVRWPTFNPDGTTLLFKVVGSPANPGAYLSTDLPERSGPG